jgi:hypothetical protein
VSAPPVPPAQDSVENALLSVLNGSAEYAIADLLRTTALEPSWASQIVAARETLPSKRFLTLVELGQVPAIGAALVARFSPTSFPELREVLSWTDRPALLLPVRVETRFVGSELLIRVYPDRPLISSHEPRLTRAEWQAGRNYLAAAAAPRDAWRQIAARFGPRRAAWIVREARRLGAAPSASVLRSDTAGMRAVPTLAALPDRFVVFLYRGDQLIRELAGQQIPGPLPLLADAAANEAGLLEGAAAWVADFAKAELVGMAIRVGRLTTQDLTDGFSKVIVVGLRSGGATRGSQALTALIDQHHYTNGIGFVPWGTPTNNTRDAKSGHSQSTEDREASYDVEIIGPTPWTSATVPRTNAQRLGHALGLGTVPASLRYLERAADDSGDLTARHLQTALWPATGDYLLRHLMPGLVTDPNLTRLGQHFVHFVRAGGPLPTIRLAGEPYGVLPVSPVRQWTESVNDNPTDPAAATFDRALHTILSALHARWLSWSLDKNRVPKVNTTLDPDKELLQILSMSPVSLSYQVRPFVDERFVAWLLMAMRDYVFGPDTPYAQLSTVPYHWVKEWSSTWAQMRDEQGEWWQGWTTAPKATVAATPLLRLTAWWLARDLDTDVQVPFVRHTVEGVEDGPAQYLGDLCRGVASQSATLLGDLLRRSLALADTAAFDRATITNAMCSLATIAPAEIEGFFRDTLDLCSHRLDAWITSLATKRLMAMRRARPSGLHVGAFGFTENLKRRAARPSAGYIHAPSGAQAAAAAVLHNAYLTHANAGETNPFRINLNSERVGRANRILAGLRQGQPLGALLGYQFERELHERQQDRFIDQFRAAFPLVAAKDTSPATDESVEAMAARNVVDGLALARWWDNPDRTDVATGDVTARTFARTVRDGANTDHRVLRQEVKRVQNTIDAVSDVLMYEGVYHAVQGNYERGGAAVDAASGQLYPPEIEAVRTPVSSKTLGHRVCLLLRAVGASATNGPRAQIEPRVAGLAGDLLGSPGDIACGYKIPGGLTGTVTIADLGLDSVDLLYLAGSPLKGEETEIEARIQYFVRARHQLAADTRVRIDPSRIAGFAYGLDEALELARQTMDTLGAGVPLRPEALVSPADGVPVLFRDADVAALDQRVGTALALLCPTLVALGGSAIRDANGVSLCADATAATTIQGRLDALMAASRWGVPVAIPTAPSDPTLDTRCADVVRLLNDRVGVCRRLREEAFETNGTTPSATRKVECLRKAVAALFGNTITVLPTFTTDSTLGAAFDRPGLLPAPLDEHRVRLWMQQVALVHEPVERLDDLMVVADGWRQSTPRAATPALRLRITQLPSIANERWLALDDSERGEALHAAIDSGRGRVSIVAATNDPSDILPTALAGVLLDQWDERIPSNRVDTSVAFQYDAPGTQAPQTLLLAVPGTREATGVWSVRELAEIVRDTMDLAKIRAVDTDAMGKREGDPPREPGTGAVLPALMLPADPTKPGWARTAFANTVEEWVTALTWRPSFGADFARYLAGQGWGMIFDEMGFQVRGVGGGGASLTPVSPYGVQYPRTGIEFFWTAAPRGDSIVFDLGWHGLLSFALPVQPTVTAYDAAGAAVGSVAGPWATHAVAFPLARARRVRIVGGWDANQAKWYIESIGLHPVVWP